MRCSLHHEPRAKTESALVKSVAATFSSRDSSPMATAARSRRQARRRSMPLVWLAALGVQIRAGAHRVARGTQGCPESRQRTAAHPRCPLPAGLRPVADAPSVMRHLQLDLALVQALAELVELVL